MNDPHHVYLDLDVINNNENNKVLPSLRFEEIRNTPFLDGDSSEYFCSIVRFTIQTGNTLPVFIPKIKIGQPDKAITIYVVTLKWTTTTSGSNPITHTVNRSVNYTPEDLVAPDPLPPLDKQDISSSFYYVHNYGHFITMVNTALLGCMNDLRFAVGGPGTVLDTVQPPFLDFDPITNRVILHADILWFDEVIPIKRNVNPIEIYFNERLYDLFVGLQYSYRSAIGNENYKLRVKYNNSNAVDKKIVVGPDPVTGTETIKVTYVQMYQEISSIALWSPVASIIFATALLPVMATQTSLPKDLGKDNNINSYGNNSNLLSAISDFSIAVDSNNQYRPMVVYNPGAEYRLIDMHSCMNLNKVDIIVYWKDTFGNIHPFELQPGCSANVKLMFRRKDFNTTS